MFHLHSLCKRYHWLFVNIGDPSHAKRVLKAAFLHNGYALVDILQPCVTFNKINTYQWFKENSYRLDDDHDTTDLAGAMQKAMEGIPMPIGVLYAKGGSDTFEARVRGENRKPLYALSHDTSEIQRLFDAC